MKSKVKYTHVRVWVKTKELLNKAEKVLNKGKKHVQFKEKWNNPKLIHSAVVRFVKHNRKTKGDEKICNFLNNKDSLNSLNTPELKI